MGFRFKGFLYAGEQRGGATAAPRDLCRGFGYLRLLPRGQQPKP